MSLCIRSFCYHKKSGRVFVYSVHQTQARVGHIIFRIVAEMPCKSIHKCA